jgi:hypothetical protein
MADSEPEREDHDQRLKVLLKELFEQFFLCFFPVWAKRFDFTDVTFLDKEVFLSPPQGKKKILDVVARLRVRPEAPLPRPDSTELLAVVNIEVESDDKVAPARPKIFDYYVQLRRDTQLPVLPIGLYLRVGLDGIGWDSYEEHFWEHRLLRFEFAYVGLPKLDGAAYVSGEHLLGVALSALMKVPAERRVELHAEALKRIAQSGENDSRRYLLAECLGAYGDLDEAQEQRLQALLATEPYQEARHFMATTYERGIVQGQRQTALKQLEVKFGPLSPEVRQRVEALTSEQLTQLSVDLLEAESLKELHLED